jgi:hypothetical protein
VIEDEVYIPAMGVEIQPPPPANHPDDQALKQTNEENPAKNP